MPEKPSSRTLLELRPVLKEIKRKRSGVTRKTYHQALKKLEKLGRTPLEGARITGKIFILDFCNKRGFKGEKRKQFLKNAIEMLNWQTALSRPLKDHEIESIGIKLKALHTNLNNILTKEENELYSKRIEIFKGYTLSEPLFWKETSIDSQTYGKIYERVLKEKMKRGGLVDLLSGRLQFMADAVFNRILKKEILARAKFLTLEEKKEVYKSEVITSRMYKKFVENKVTREEYEKCLVVIINKIKKLLGPEKIEKLNNLTKLIKNEITSNGGGKFSDN